MREFFHGWRRKVGCVLLALSVLVIGLSMRSQMVYDEIYFTLGDRSYSVGSIAGRIYLRSLPNGPEGYSLAWVADNVQPSFRPRVDIVRGYEFHLQAIQECDGGLGCVVDLWRLLLPSALLAACLILWKPR